MINLKVLERMLCRLGVKSVLTFNDASKALDYLNDANDPSMLPNLILSDLQMPIMSGFQFMGHLRELSSFDAPPTVMACSGKCTPAVALCNSYTFTSTFPIKCWQLIGIPTQNKSVWKQGSMGTYASPFCTLS